MFWRVASAPVGRGAAGCAPSGPANTAKATARKNGCLSCLERKFIIPGLVLSRRRHGPCVYKEMGLATVGKPHDARTPVSPDESRQPAGPQGSAPARAGRTGRSGGGSRGTCPRSGRIGIIAALPEIGPHLLHQLKADLLLLLQALQGGNLLG